MRFSLIESSRSILNLRRIGVTSDSECWMSLRSLGPLSWLLFSHLGVTRRVEGVSAASDLIDGIRTKPLE